MVVRAEPFAFLSTLQAWQLKRLAFLSGLNTSGTKQLLHGKLANSLSKPSLPAPKCRVLSVDMGVKNLAFCLLDLQQIPQHAGDADARYNDSTLSLHVADWKRLNVSQRFGDKSAGSTAGLVDDVQEGNEKSIDMTASDEQANPYTPSSLSKIAFGLASEFLRYRPDYILIERQRFRSGGGPAIQEWTVRVNMLESMLWASLETMSHGHDRNTATQDRPFPKVLEMSPRRVGMFWLDREDLSPTPADMAVTLLRSKETVLATEVEATTKMKKKSFEKKDKIALARHWLSLSMTTDDMTVDAKLAQMVASFCSPRLRQSRRQGKEDQIEEDVETKDEGVTTSGKLDDLADCLVQAVTFAVWEQNRTRIQSHIEGQVKEA